MITSLLLIAAAVPVTAMTPVLDSALAAGLSVAIDGIPEPVAVDGVSMTVQRVTGTGVPELAGRIETRWRSQGSEVRALQQGTWTVRSRFQGARSEVMQWRSSSDGPELLVSAVDVQAAVRAVPDTGLALPAGCAWGRSIAGRNGSRSYVQRSARCTQSVPVLSRQLRQSLQPQGWTLRNTTATALLVERAGAEGLISLTTNDGDPATWITWLRTESAR